MVEEKIENIEIKKGLQDRMSEFNIEKNKDPEQAIEQAGEKQQSEKPSKQSEKLNSGEGEIGQVVISDPKSRYKKRQKEIEKVLEKNLEDTYLKMPIAIRKKFKEKGEYTAGKINELLEMTKLKTGKIISLIIKWFKIIPGVNKFFIEQEAKIKADEIISLKKD